jgi:hypothetical protein
MGRMTKLDSRRRGVFPETFKPGDMFLQETTSPDAVTFKRITPDDVPVVKIRKVKGRWMGIDIQVDPSVILAAIRADRDSR